MAKTTSSFTSSITFIWDNSSSLATEAASTTKMEIIHTVAMKSIKKVKHKIWMVAIWNNSSRIYWSTKFQKEKRHQYFRSSRLRIGLWLTASITSKTRITSNNSEQMSNKNLLLCLNKDPIRLCQLNLKKISLKERMRSSPLWCRQIWFKLRRRNVKRRSWRSIKLSIILDKSL